MDILCSLGTTLSASYGLDHIILTPNSDFFHPHIFLKNVHWYIDINKVHTWYVFISRLTCSHIPFREQYFRDFRGNPCPAPRLHALPEATTALGSLTVDGFCLCLSFRDMESCGRYSFTSGRSPSSLCPWHPSVWFTVVHCCVLLHCLHTPHLIDPVQVT